MANYFYAINNNDIQQINDNLSAYALASCDNLVDYYIGLTMCSCEPMHAIKLDGVQLSPAYGSWESYRSHTLHCTYLIPKQYNEVIYIYNPDAKNPAYIQGGKLMGDLAHTYSNINGPWGEGGAKTAWKLYAYKEYERIIDANKRTADIIYGFGGYRVLGSQEENYGYPSNETKTMAAVQARKNILDKCKVLRFRPIKEMEDIMDPFGLALYDENGKLIYCCDNKGRNYQMSEYYINPTYINGSFSSGQSPKLSHTSDNYNNVAVSPITHPYRSEGITTKGHPSGTDPSANYPIKLLKNQWSISTLEGCGVGYPGKIDNSFGGGKWRIGKAEGDSVTVSQGSTSQISYPYDRLDGHYGMSAAGFFSLMAMDCTRYIE